MVTKTKVKPQKKTTRKTTSKKAVSKDVVKTKSTGRSAVASKSNVTGRAKSGAGPKKTQGEMRKASPAGTGKPVKPVVKRVINHPVERRPALSRTPRVHQFAYMKAPGIEHEFEVGDSVEVFCDHEKNRDRIRGWIKGIVVQVDNKMVAVQFRSNVFLTDGWMVPDRILWYPLNSEHIRPGPGKKSTVKKDFIPDY